jgi:hypothetical protein
MTLPDGEDQPKRLLRKYQGKSMREMPKGIDPGLGKQGDKR